MTITMDLYKQLEIERTWNEKKIKETLKSRQNEKEIICNLVNIVYVDWQ